MYQSKVGHESGSRGDYSQRHQVLYPVVCSLRPWLPLRWSWQTQWNFTLSPPILLSLQLTPHLPGSALVQSHLDSLFSSWQNPGIFLEPSRLDSLYWLGPQPCRDNPPPTASRGLTANLCLACRLCWRALFLSAGRGNGQWALVLYLHPLPGGPGVWRYPGVQSQGLQADPAPKAKCPLQEERWALGWIIPNCIFSGLLTLWF